MEIVPMPAGAVSMDAVRRVQVPVDVKGACTDLQKSDLWSPYFTPGPASREPPSLLKRGLDSTGRKAALLYVEGSGAACVIKEDPRVCKLCTAIDVVEVRKLTGAGDAVGITAGGACTAEVLDSRADGAEVVCIVATEGTC
jgi:hypothetical protein